MLGDRRRQARGTALEGLARRRGQTRQVGGQRRQRAALAAPLAMPGREVEVDVGGQPRRGRPPAREQPEGLEGLGEAVLDGGHHQLVLRCEVGVEAAVREPRALHHTGHRDALRPLGADRRRGFLQHPLTGALLVLGVIAHRPIV